MAACPNCGRRTLRTKDWVCQWCGYPLLYGGFKPIDKTYKELQEERSPSYKSEEPETEPEVKYEPEPEPEPEPKPDPLWKQRRPPKPSYRPPPQPAPRPVAQTSPQPVPQPRPELAPQPLTELLPRSRPEPVLLPKEESAPQPAPQPVARPRPETPPEPKPELIMVPSLNSITDGTQLTIDQIDALFRADSVGISTAMKDKTLVVKGIVNKVFIRDHIDVRYLILTGARKVIWSARCSFEKESVADMSRLSEGQAVALRGKYEGYGKNIIFKECTLVASS